jgi:hypothetical protein
MIRLLPSCSRGRLRCCLKPLLNMSLLVLSASDVRKVASSFSTTFLQELMGRVFTAFSRRPNSGAAAPSIQVPHRTAIEMKSHTTLFMPVRVTSPPDALEGTTVKVVSVPRDEGDVHGLPATTLNLNEETGAVDAVLNARELTALRNAGGSSIATHSVCLWVLPNAIFWVTRFFIVCDSSWNTKASEYSVLRFWKTSRGPPRRFSKTLSKHLILHYRQS